MRIGIFVHSQTGHTYFFAQTIAKRLTSAGHDVKIERIKPVGDIHPRSKKIAFEKTPSTSEYDLLLFGAPVWAFGLSPVIRAFLGQIQSIQGKKAAGFVTQAFPFAWMGGNNAISAINKLIAAKGATVLKGQIVHWFAKKPETALTAVVEKIAKVIQ